MKFRAIFPEQKFYVPLRQKGDKFVFEDKDTSLIRVSSPVVNPFGKEWDVMIDEQTNKSDRTRYLARVVFKLFPTDGATERVLMRRECIKAKLLNVDTSNCLHLIEAVEGFIRIIYRFE